VLPWLFSPVLGQPAVAQSDAVGLLPPLIERYQADRESLARRYPLALSPQRGERLRQVAEQYLRTLDELPYDRLPTDDRVDYHLFANQLRHERAELGHQTARDAAASVLLPFAPALVESIDAPGMNLIVVMLFLKKVCSL
jgi:hypothetical protein